MGNAPEPAADPGSDPPRPAEPDEADDEGVDRGQIMESLDMFITEEPPAAAAPLPAAAPPRPTASRSAPDAELEMRRPPVPAEVTPPPVPSTAPGGLAGGVRNARYLWRFLRLPGLRTPEADLALRALLLLCTLTIGLVWLLIAYLTPHPVPYFFAVAFLVGPALLALHRLGRKDPKSG